ncbi:hypothetical protein BV20DRAFT_909139, partial [Pilatotrama ljubarskyi]
LIAIPKEGDLLFSLVASVKSYMQGIYGTIPYTSELCRQILNTDILTEDLNHTPFSQHQMEDTLHAYSRLVLQLLCFLLRGEADLILPEAVSQALARLRLSLNREIDDVTSAIHSLLLALWTRNWSSTQANPFPDPTVCFIIHTQLNRDGSLKGPKDVTGIFAKLVYNMRLVFLKECHRLSAEDPAHPSHAIAARSLRPWFTIGQESTFHSLRSLQHRASSIVVSTQNEPNMKWKDGSNFTTLIYLGHEVSLDALRRCQGAIEDATCTLLQDTLLFGHPFTIDIAALKDDMGNSQPGYSLFTDRVNAQVLGCPDQLIDHILCTPALRHRFVIGLRDGKIIWNGVALSAWLNAYSKLDRLCLIQAEMNCGAPGRTTELTGMPRTNTKTGMLRALRIIDGHVALMRTYHKMRAAQGLDRVIPHSLNASLAATFIYKEALCRSFAELCASVLYPDNPKVKSYYQDYLFVNYDRPFVGDDISEEMKWWTGQHLSVELGIQKWRQCSTPLRRKHAGLEEMWLEDQDTVDSAQAGHSHRVDWMRYGVTERATLGLAEDYIGPFFKTSVLWHNVLHLVPGGKLLSLEASARTNYQAPAPAPATAPQAAIPAVNFGALAEEVISRLEPRLAALEQRVQATATSHEVKGMFSELKTLLQGALQPASAAPAPAPSVHQPPLPNIQEMPEHHRQRRSPSPDDPTEGMYYDPPASTAPPLSLPAPAAPIPMPTEQEALTALRQVLQKPDAHWSNEGQRLAVMSGLEWQKDVV